MKGAVSTIAIIVIASVVVVAIGLNYYKPGETPSIRPTPIDTQRACQSKLLAYCTQWNSNGYGRDAVTTGNRPGPWDSFASGCNRLGVTPTADICSRTLRANPTTGRAATVGNLGFLDACNPRLDNCERGLVCKLGRDTYRCLRQN